MQILRKITPLCVLMGLVLLAAGCGDGPKSQSLVESENKELMGRIAALEEENAELRAEVKELNAEVSMFASQEEDGLLVTEQRKALTEREANLEQREADIIAQEEQLRQRQLSIAQKESEFHQATNMTMQDIGRAQQLQDEYEDMRQQRNQAEERVASYTTWLFVLLAGLLAALLFGIISWIRMIHRTREQENIVRLVGNFKSLTPEERKHLSTLVRKELPAPE